jgi:hypothetical protein
VDGRFLRRLEAGWGLKRDFQSPAAELECPGAAGSYHGPARTEIDPTLRGSSGVQVLDGRLRADHYGPMSIVTLRRDDHRPVTDNRLLGHGAESRSFHGRVVFVAGTTMGSPST